MIRALKTTVRAVGAGDVMVVPAENDGGREAAVRHRRVEGHGQLATALTVGVQDPRLAPNHHLVGACLLDPPSYALA